MESLLIRLPAEYHLLSIDQTADALEMLFINKLPVIGIFKRIVTVLRLDLAADLLNKRVLDRTLAKDLIGCHAGLTTVEIFSEHDALCGKLQLGGTIHDARTLSPQL